jgi:hypothetical protein
MGNLKDIQNTMIDIFQEAPPVAYISVHLNRAYIWMDFPTNGPSIMAVSVTIKKWSTDDNMEIDPDDLLEVTSYQFIPGATVYAIDDPYLPTHHVFLDLENFIYTLEFKYMYQPSALIDGGNIFYSEESIYFINNIHPLLYTGYISEYMVGDFKDAMSEDNSINIWFETDIADPQKFDLVKLTGSIGYKTIIETFNIGIPPYQLGLTQETTLKFISKLTSEYFFGKTVDTYFNTDIPQEIPTDSIIVFKFLYNNTNYTLKFIGNIQNLIRNYLLYEYDLEEL